MLFSTEREMASHPFGAAPMVSLTLVVYVCRSPVIIYAIGRACFGDCDILVRRSKGFFTLWLFLWLLVCVLLWGINSPKIQNTVLGKGFFYKGPSVYIWRHRFSQDRSKLVVDRRCGQYRCSPPPKCDVILGVANAQRKSSGVGGVWFGWSLPSVQRGHRARRSPNAFLDSLFA